MSKYIPVLTIAGSDSSGGAGIQADIKTISALGCYGMSAITAITAQNTCGVYGISGVASDMVEAQIDAVFSDIRPRAVKTGMLYSRDVVDAVVNALSRHKCDNLVVDPVMVSTSGSLLIDHEAIEAMVKRLFPLATLVTPNKAEARVLTRYDNVYDQAEEFHRKGVNAVLLKGGDDEDQYVKTDYLSIYGMLDMVKLSSKAVATANSHGTGCTLSSAIASYMARDHNLVESVRLAKRYTTEALKAGANVSIGLGHGPVNHLYNPQKLIIEQ